jgi:AAA domain-containing protein
MTITSELFEKMRVHDEKDDAWSQVKARYEILSVTDALKPQPPIKWIVSNLISAGSVNIFYGEGGSKKTYALFDLAVCAARGETWLNFKTQAAPVLVIDEESGQRRIMQRMGEVLRGHNADSDTPIFCVSLAAFDFGNPNDIDELHNLIIETKAQLVIIDALADVMPGRDENAVKDVQPVFLSLRRIAEATKAAIIIIHHSNKGGNYRGSTAIKGAVDLLVSVASRTGSNEISFKVEKARDSIALNFGATANFMADMFKLVTSTNSTSQEFNKGQRYVLRYLLNNSASTMNDIMSNADSCSERTAKNSVYRLANAGFVVRTNEGGQGAKAIYDLTDKGRGMATKL